METCVYAERENKKKKNQDFSEGCERVNPGYKRRLRVVRTRRKRKRYLCSSFKVNDANLVWKYYNIRLGTQGEWVTSLIIFLLLSCNVCETKNGCAVRTRNIVSCDGNSLNRDSDCAERIIVVPIKTIMRRIVRCTGRKLNENKNLRQKKKNPLIIFYVRTVCDQTTRANPILYSTITNRKSDRIYDSIAHNDVDYIDTYYSCFCSSSTSRRLLRPVVVCFHRSLFRVDTWSFCTPNPGTILTILSVHLFPIGPPV